MAQLVMGPMNSPGVNGELMSSELFTCGCGGLATVGSVLFIQCHFGTGLSGFIARRHVFDVPGRDNIMRDFKILVTSG